MPARRSAFRSSADPNTGDNEGSYYFHVNQKRGRRWSAARGFLKPVLGRPNLRLVTDVQVEKVLFEGKRATGVRYRKRGQNGRGARQGRSDPVRRRHRFGADVAAFRRRARRMAGASGRAGGACRWKAWAAICRIICNCAPCIGCQGVKTLNEVYYSLLGRPLMGLQYALLRRGPMTMAASQLCIVTKSDPSQERANIQFHIQPLSLDRFGTPLHRFPAITVSPCNLRPTSRGTVRITSAALDAAPQIAPNYLSTDEDRRIAAEALRLTRRLMRQPALAQYHPEEFRPGPDVADSDADLIHAAGDIGTTIFHPVGTAKMGLASDPLAVVDERLRVHGLAELAGDRRLGDADHHLGQHQHPHHHDRRQGRGDGAGRRV